MNSADGLFWAWPGWTHLRYTGRLALAQLIWFECMFWSTDFLTARRSFRVSVDLPVDGSFPFAPSSVVVYSSIYLLFLMAPFVLRSARETRALVVTLAIATLCAGVCFLMLPASLAYPPLPAELGFWAPLFRLADWLNLDYNLLPSLHVALSIICIGAFVPKAGPVGKTLLWGWGMAIAASTLLTHQHHLLDVVTGFMLAFLAIKCAYERLLIPAWPGPATNRNENPIQTETGLG